jgi:Lipocalin-like domain
MKIRSLVALAGLTISSALPTFAQQASDLVGAWTLVSITLNQDGKKTDMYGPNPQGQLMYDATGHFSVIITRSDLPKFSSNNRETGTAEENKTIVQGSLAYFGTYSVSETDKTITTHIESSTFPNWNGVDRKTSFNISGDELSTHVISGPLTSIGTGTAYVVWKRAK